MREECDYNCAYDISSDELIEKIEPVRQLIEKITEMVKITDK